MNIINNKKIKNKNNDEKNANKNKIVIKKLLFNIIIFSLKRLKLFINNKKVKNISYKLKNKLELHFY